MAQPPHPNPRPPKLGNRYSHRWPPVSIAVAGIVALAVAVALVATQPGTPRPFGSRPTVPAAMAALPSLPPLPALHLGDCAMLGPDIRRLPNTSPTPMPDQNDVNGIPFAAMAVPCIPPVFVLSTTTIALACAEGYISAPDQDTNRIDCLTLDTAQVGQCMTLIGPETDLIPLLGQCDGDPRVRTARVTSIVPHAATGVYGCPVPTAAYYIGVHADVVACLSPATGPSTAPS